MDMQALFKISHGVYITGAIDTAGRLIGSCVDSVMVTEVAPPQVLVSLSKESYTCQNVLKTHELTLSVLAQNVPNEVITRFGTMSSRTADKWVPDSYHLVSGLPVLNDSVATLFLTVLKAIETEHHHIFLCRVVQAQMGSNRTAVPLIYADYQQQKKENKMMEQTTNKKWVCTVCGYVYDGDVPFEDLPEDWVCPLCGEPKSVFVQE